MQIFLTKTLWSFCELTAVKEKAKDWSKILGSPYSKDFRSPEPANGNCGLCGEAGGF